MICVDWNTNNTLLRTNFFSVPYSIVALSSDLRFSKHTTEMKMTFQSQPQTQRTTYSWFSLFTLRSHCIPTTTHTKWRLYKRKANCHFDFGSTHRYSFEFDRFELFFFVSKIQWKKSDVFERNFDFECFGMLFFSNLFFQSSIHIKWFGLSLVLTEVVRWDLQLIHIVLSNL